MLHMQINDQLIRNAFGQADQHFEFCWQVLADMKLSLVSEDFAIRFVQFQDKLGETIFNLHTIREQILLEERARARSKSSYKQDWFLSRMGNLSIEELIWL